MQTKLQKYEAALDKFMLAGSEDSSEDQVVGEGPYVPGKTQVGQTFKHSDGKTYKVVNADDPNDPDVLEV